MSTEPKLTVEVKLCGRRIGEAECGMAGPDMLRSLRRAADRRDGETLRAVITAYVSLAISKGVVDVALTKEVLAEVAAESGE